MERANTEFIKFVSDTFDELKLQFIAKNEQYGTVNPLANFETGAMLRYKTDSYKGMFEAAVDYETKHIAHVVNQGITGEKVDESLKDIAIYSVIELYLIKKHKEKNNA